MKHTRLSCFALSVFAVLLFVAGAPQTQAQQASKKTPDSPENKPEALGFSSERLERLHAAMQGEVDQKQLAGIVTILARHGKVVEERTYGKKDIASGAPMTRDTIFRIFSMTKPVTGVAMMILYEEGKWHPSDPVSKYIPEFAHLRVFKGVDQSGKMILEEPVHPPTMRELMTHTAGFTYGVFGTSLVDKMYLDEQVFQSRSLKDMIDKLAKIPLLYQPGTRWVYSVSMDIQGYLVEKLSGQSLPDFMQQHIFAPLGMKDTGFFVPKEKRNRFATLYREDQKGQLAADATAGGAADYATQPTMPSGGGGMVSTAQDYLRFAQMLLNGGELDGVPILAPATVQAHDLKPSRPRSYDGRVLDRSGDHPARPGVGLRLRSLHGPAASRPSGRQRHFLLDRSGGHLVLGRSHERSDFCWHDPANVRPRVAHCGGVEPTLRLSGASEAADVTQAL